MNIQLYKILLASLMGLVLVACNSTSVRTTQNTATAQPQIRITEDQLLDVGIDLFNPGVDELSEEEPGVFLEVRRAEARYMPYKLMETLQITGYWGVVRVIPNKQSEMDLWVDAEITKSDGESLHLTVKLTDATGRVWYTKKYKEFVSKYVYDGRRGTRTEPFQNLYNRIVNDMIAFRSQLKPEDAIAIRTVTELRFAKRFSPEVFNGHLETDGKGKYTIKRLPAENDPILQRVRKLRERDYMFVDTLQDYYGSFVQEMEEPYRSWRRESYHETMTLREMQNKSNAQLIGGAAAIIAGILGKASDSSLAQAAGYVGMVGGGYLVEKGMGTREEAKMHAEALKELGSSLDAEVESHAMTLEESTVTLSGTVNDQYSQWRQLLRDIYVTETGQDTTNSN